VWHFVHWLARYTITIICHCIVLLQLLYRWQHLSRKLWIPPSYVRWVMAVLCFCSGDLSCIIFIPSTNWSYSWWLYLHRYRGHRVKVLWWWGWLSPPTDEFRSNPLWPMATKPKYSSHGSYQCQLLCEQSGWMTGEGCREGWRGRFGRECICGTLLHWSECQQRELPDDCCVAAVQFCVQRWLCMDPGPPAGTAELPGEHTLLDLWGHVSGLPTATVPLHYVQLVANACLPCWTSANFFLGLPFVYQDANGSFLWNVGTLVSTLLLWGAVYFSNFISQNNKAYRHTWQYILLLALPMLFGWGWKPVTLWHIWNPWTL
jgi:hypothetical protein